MPGDKYTAVWVSHSSMGDFLKCPRAYFLKNVYKNPETRRKITLMSPSLALGQAVHEVIEGLSNVETSERFSTSLIERFHHVWPKVSGKKGGFTHGDQEERFRLRGEDMLRKVMADPGPLKNLAVKIKMDLPHYWLSEEENIILCGKIDWLEYLPDTDSVNILDFKTGQNEEDGESLQLPIYYLLVNNVQKRHVSGAYYWYLATDTGLIEKTLPDLQLAHTQVLELAKKIKVARKLNVFKCAQGSGCRFCQPYEAIVAGEAEFVGTNEYRTDVYILNSQLDADKDDSMIL